jgi:hypothetical protein
VATGGNDRRTRAERERARLYQARRQFHEGLGRRRRRDNLLAGVVGGVLLLGALGAQTAYFTAGPGAPEPSATPTPESTSTPDPMPSPTSSPTVPVSPSPTP